MKSIDVADESLADARRCPHLAGYDPTSEEELREPYPTYAASRSEQPVFYSPEWGMYFVHRQEDCVRVLTDDGHFGVGGATRPIIHPPAELQDRMPTYPWDGALVTLDDPEHKPARQVVQAPFKPKNLRQNEPVVRAKAEELISAHLADGGIEFVSGYSLPLALHLIGLIIGFPEEKYAQVSDGVAAQFELMGSGLKTPGDVLAAGRRLADLNDYMLGLVRDRRENPQDDYTSEMVHMRKEDGTFESDERMVKHVFTIIGAGFETSTQMMVHGVRALLEHPDQWEKLKADRSLVNSAVEETLRYRTLVRRLFRAAKTDVLVGGVEIPKGATVSLVVASANHDESVYEDPERFDITRNPDHLAFNKWKHFCIGAPLARMEMRVTLEVLMDLVPDMKLADQEFEWRPDLRFEALKALELEWQPRVQA